MSSSCPAVMRCSPGGFQLTTSLIDDRQDPAAAELHRRRRALLDRDGRAVGGRALLDGHARHDEHPRRADRDGRQHLASDRRGGERRRGQGVDAARLEAHRTPSPAARRGRGRTAAPRCAGRCASSAHGAPTARLAASSSVAARSARACSTRSVRSMSEFCGIGGHERDVVRPGGAREPRVGIGVRGDDRDAPLPQGQPDAVAQRPEADHDDVVARVADVGSQDVRDPGPHEHVHDQAIERGEEDGTHDDEPEGEVAQRRLVTVVQVDGAQDALERLDDRLDGSRVTPPARRTPRRRPRAPR